MNNVVKLGHDVYDRGSMLDYQVEDVLMRDKVYPYLEKHKLNNIGSFKALINIMSNSAIKEILAKLGTLVASWDDRIFMVGNNEERPFVADVRIESSINCLQMGVLFWAHMASDQTIEDAFKVAFKDVLSKVNDSVVMDVEWFYSQPDQGVRSSGLREIIYETVYKEAYPYLDLDTFMAGYFKSSSSVMIIAGVPGTGKTKLIRHIIRSAVEKKADFITKFKLKHRYDDDDYEPVDCGPIKGRKDTDAFGKIKVAYTTDVNTLSDDNFYIKLRTNNYHFVVLEDIDFKLKPRAEENDIMHKFLAVSDGFISSNCKIIMSTNLGVGEIDQALVRKGRCYASLETRKLNSREALAVLEKLGKPQDLDPKKEYTLADLYSLAYHLTYVEANGEDLGIEPKIGFGARK